MDARAKSSPFLDTIGAGCFLTALVALAITMLFSFALKSAGIGTFNSTLDVLTHLLGVVVCTAVAITAFRKVGPSRSEAQERLDRCMRESEAGIVEEFHITTDHAVLFHPYDRDGCNTGLAIDIGNSKTLVLFGDLRGDPTI